MAFDGAVGAVIDGTSTHLGLHDAERLFYFPACAVDFQQVGYGVMCAAVAVGVFFEICADSVEAVVLLFIGYAVFVDVVAGIYVGDFTLLCAFVFDDVASEVFGRFIGVAVTDCFSALSRFCARFMR